MRKSINEVKFQQSEGIINKQFYYNLLHIENAIIKEPKIDLVQQALGMYRKCVEYFDNIQDPIKFYFLDKIQQAVSETKTLMLLINSKQDLEVQSQSVSPIKISSSLNISPQSHLSDNLLIEKKLRSKQVEMQIKLHEATDTQNQMLNTMVTDFTSITNNTDQKIKSDLNQQVDIIQARLQKRQQSIKLKACQSLQTLM